MKTYLLMLFVLNCTTYPNQPPISVSVRAGRIFTVRLPSSIGTGFTWQLADSIDVTRLHLLSKQYKESAVELDGRPGADLFTFKALRPGQTALRLRYIRPWLKSVPPDTPYQSVRITIR